MTDTPGPILTETEIEPPPKPAVLEQAAEKVLVGKAVPGDGWLRDYVDWCYPCSEAPRLFHLACGLSCLSAAIGRRAFLQVGPSRIYGNTFVALIGSQGVTRKSTALHLASNLIDDTFEGLLYEGDTTPEALQRKVLGETPERLLFADELSSVLGGAEYTRHIRQLLATLYDCPDRLAWARVGAGGDGCIERPVVSVLGASTMAWLRSCTNAADVGGGILSRFLWAVSAHDGRLLPLPPEPDANLRARLQGGLRDLRTALDAGGEHKMSMDAAFPVHAEFYNAAMTKANREQEEGLGGFIARLVSAHAPRLAMLLTLARDPLAREVCPQVYRDHVIPLVAVLENGMRRVVGGITQTEADAVMSRIMEFVRKTGPGGCLKRDFQRTFRPRLQKRELEPLLETLEEAGELLVTKGDGGARLLAVG